MVHEGQTQAMLRPTSNANASTDYKSSAYYEESEEEEEEEEEEADEEEEEDEDSDTPPKVPEIIGAGLFRVKHEIGSGSYSQVHLGVNTTSGEKVAVKCEWMKAEKGDKLLGEAKLYDELGDCPDAPKIYWSGSAGQYNIMVMELLGPSIDELFKTKKKFSLKTVLMLAEQLIDRIEFVHERGILYRDIKPHNFLMGVGDWSTRVYIVDFGLAKRYRDPVTGEHIPGAKKKRKGVTGTVRYSSLNVHAGYDAGRRDDLEAIGYMLLHFLRGDLPWLGLKATAKKTKHEVIGQRKMQTPDEELCRGFPNEFVEYFKCCRALGFAEKPDYERLRSLFRGLFEQRGFVRDFRYDWVVDAEDAGKEASSKRQKRSRSRHGGGKDRAAERRTDKAARSTSHSRRRRSRSKKRKEQA